MTIRVSSAQVRHAQQIEVAVSSVDGANTLIINTGVMDINVFMNTGGDQHPNTTRDTYGLLLPTVLRPGQFRRAIATASLARVYYNASRPEGAFDMGIMDVDADWDDESYCVELRVEAFVSITGLGNYGGVAAVEFQVTTLAAL